MCNKLDVPIHACIYIYIYIYIYFHTDGFPPPLRSASFSHISLCYTTARESTAFLAGWHTTAVRAAGWLRTAGVNTHGAAAKVMVFDSLGKKVRPGTFGKVKVG